MVYVVIQIRLDRHQEHLITRLLLNSRGATMPRGAEDDPKSDPDRRQAAHPAATVAPISPCGSSLRLSSICWVRPRLCRAASLYVNASRRPVLMPLMDSPPAWRRPAIAPDRTAMAIPWTLEWAVVAQ